MSTPSYARSLLCAAKRIRISIPNTPIPIVQHFHTVRPQAAQQSNIDAQVSELRLPRAVQATYLAPLKRAPTHGIPTCDLQLRSYSLRNLEVFTDFALRAAYFLNLSASGPVPLPKMRERWTVPRANFIFKKSQENFQRTTLRRLVQIQDGHSEVVAIWLAFLRKHQYYGVGIKANVWDYSGLDVSKELDAEAERIAHKLGEKMELVGGHERMMQDEAKLEKVLLTEPFKGQWGADAPMGGNSTVPSTRKRIWVPGKPAEASKEDDEVFGYRP